MRSTISTKSDAAELQRRDVDRDGDARPGLAVEAGAAQHLLAERNDQPAVLGDRNEFDRRDLAAVGMGPAAQRFHAHDRLAAVVDDRLIGDPQLVVLDRRAQVVLEQLAIEQIGVHRLVIDAGAIAAFVLGPVERHVGVPHDVGGAANVFVDDGDSDTRADHDGLIADGVGRAKRGDHARCDRLQRGVIEAAGRDDGEFVAAQAGHQIVSAHGARDPRA